MTDNFGKHAAFDTVSQGADARRRGQTRDACPHSTGSRERDEWMEGFGGVDGDRPPDLPLDSTG